MDIVLSSAFLFKTTVTSFRVKLALWLVSLPQWEEKEGDSSAAGEEQWA
jgi:hypothetical protein